MAHVMLLKGSGNDSIPRCFITAFALFPTKQQLTFFEDQVARSKDLLFVT